MHLCTFAVGEGEMLPVFVSKNWLAPLGASLDVARLPLASKLWIQKCTSVCATHMWTPLNLAKVRRLNFRTPSLYTLAHVIWERLHIWQKWDSWTSCVCLFEHLSTSTHLTKVGLLDFSRSSVCRSGRRLHIWQGWDPSTCLIRCSTHMWAPLNLTKMRLLDFRTLSAYTFVHVITCRQNETPRLPQFVCAHIC